MAGSEKDSKASRSWSILGGGSSKPRKTESPVPPPPPPPAPPKSQKQPDDKPSSRRPSPMRNIQGSGHLKAPTELGQYEDVGSSNNSTTAPASKHVRAHARILQTRQRAKFAVRRQLTPAAIQEEREIYLSMAGKTMTFCKSFVYLGMEVLAATTKTEAFVLCARTHFVIQSLDILGGNQKKDNTRQKSKPEIISLRANASTGLIVVTTADGYVTSFYPKPSDTLKVNFAHFRWHRGPVFYCGRIFYSESPSDPKFVPARKKEGLEVSLAHNFFVLLAHRNQLAVIDVNPELAASEAEMLWTTCMPSTVVAAQISGDAHSVAVVLKPNPDDHDAADADGVHTMERDWDDGGGNSTHDIVAKPPLKAGESVKRKYGRTVSGRSSVGILYKPGPFLVHSAPVTRISFRGKGRDTSQPFNKQEIDEIPGNDLLLTVCEDNSAQIFGQSNWKPLTEWTMSPKTRVDWISGSAAMTLGDLEGKSSSSQRKKSGGSRRPSETDLQGIEQAEAANEQVGHRHSHVSSIPTHTTPISKAGAWICEICCGEGGAYPSIRLSRLTYLKRGADDLSPTLFESVSGYLPSNAIFDQTILGEAEDPATLSIQGLWPVWNPFVGDAASTSSSPDVAATNETLRGSAMAFLGLSSPHNSIGPGGVFGLGDPNLFGTQCPPTELRLTVAHPVAGYVTVLEYPLHGDKSLTSLELGRPSHSVLALNQIGMGETSTDDDSDESVVDVDSIDHGNGRLVAKINTSGTVSLTWRQPGTMAILPSTWQPGDVALPNVTDLLSNTQRLRDESLIPAPLVLRPVRLPRDMKNDPPAVIFWWPDMGVVGTPPMLLALTKSGCAIAFEIVTPLIVVTSETNASSLPPAGASQDFCSSPVHDDDLNNQSTPDYEVSIVPDPELGLGLRLESLDDGQPAIAGSFKRNPVTKGILPAEKTGLISLGDELISANDVVLEDKAFDEIIATVRDLGASSGPGRPMRLKFRRSSAFGASRASSSGSDGSNRRSMEQMIGVNPDVIQKKLPRNGYSSSQPDSQRSLGPVGGPNQIVASFRSPIAGVATAVASNNPRRKLVLLPGQETDTIENQVKTILCCAEGNNLVFSLLSLPKDTKTAAAESTFLYSCVAFDVEEIEAIQSLEVEHTSYFMFVLGKSGLIRLAVTTIDIRSKKYSSKFYDVTNLSTSNPSAVELRPYSVRLFATLDTSCTSPDPLSVWTAKPHPGCNLHKPEKSGPEGFSYYVRSSIRIDGGVQSNGGMAEKIVDFGFVESGYLDSSPWLLVFYKHGLAVHHRPGGGGLGDWIPLTNVSYATFLGPPNSGTPSLIVNADARPRDLFPHLIQAVRASLPSTDEVGILRSDWHPEALLTNMCISDKGASHALKSRIRDLYIWLCSEGTNIKEDQADSPLLCAPLSILDKEVKDSSQTAAARTTENILDTLVARGSVEPDGKTKEVAMLKKLQKLLSEGSRNRIFREKLKPDSCSVIELPTMLRSSSADDLTILWALGEMILNPPDFQSTDVSGQLYIFSATLDDILKKEIDSRKEEKTTKAFGFSFLRKESSSRQNQTENTGHGPLVASGACLSALMSNSQNKILAWVKQEYPKMDWPTARRIRLPFWIRSDESLARICEEIGQTLFREKRDVMECALFFIIARKLRTLRNLAATDQSESGRKFFNFITSHDFSSERGRSAAEKNAFSLLRKCRYQVAAAFFLLAEPPSLNTALETIVTKMHDTDLAFMVARLMESREIAPPTPMMGGGLGGFGGGGGYAGTSVITSAPVGDDQVKFQHWTPRLGKTTKKLIVDRLFQKSPDDSAMCAMNLLWMNKREEASWWVPGFIECSASSETGYRLVQNLEQRLSDKLKGRADFRLSAVEKANAIIDFASIPLLQKTMRSSLRSRYAGSLFVSSQLVSRGVEIPSLWSLLFYVGDGASDSRDNDGLGTLGKVPRSGAQSTPQSSIFDSFDSAPKPKPAPVVQSFIFDSFDVPAPKPALVVQSSIFDSFDVPNPKPAPVVQSSVFDSFDVPTPKPAPVVQSSIFDSFDVPTPKSAPVVQSSIFDSFEVPTPTPASAATQRNDMSSSILDNFNGSSGGDTRVQANTQSSIFDSYDTPIPQKNGSSMSSNPQEPQKPEAKVDSMPEYEIHLCVSKSPVSEIWFLWKERLIVLGVTRRLIREVGSVCANFHGDPSEVSVEDFFLEKLPILPSGASSVLQVRCDASGILARVKSSLLELCAVSGMDVHAAVISAVRHLGNHSHYYRLVFSVVLYASIERYDLAESIMRDAAGSLILQTKACALMLDDTYNRKRTRHQVSSIQMRRLSARVCWQLEACLWLHRGGGIPLSGLAFKETTIAVRLGVLLSTWNRTPSAIESILRCEPDTIVDDEEGAHLWSSLKQTLPDAPVDKNKKTTSGGWEFFVDCRRSEATKILRESPTGSFIIRPHPNDTGVFTLSFKTNLVPGEEPSMAPDAGQDVALEGADPDSQERPPKPSAKSVKKDDIVQHAIIRLADSGFRCGSFGPFTSLLDLLESVSESLPFPLRFDLPPSNRVIREEGSQPSPNAVLFRKLALTHASSMASPPLDDSLQALEHSQKPQIGDRWVQSNERHRSFGIFLELLTLSKLRKQLCGIAVVEYEDSDVAKAGHGHREGDIFNVAYWIVGPLLDWCRSLEVRGVVELCPNVPSLWTMLPGKSQSQALMDVSEESVEVTLGPQPVNVVPHSGDSILRAMIQRDSGVDFSTLRLVDGGECSMVVLFSKQEAIQWLTSSGTEQSEADAIRRLEKMEKERVIEPIDFSTLPLKNRPTDLTGVRYRFVDPWEVEAVSTREGETRSASLGRQHFLGFSLGKIALACESDLREIGGIPLLELWMSGKGGIVLSRALAAVHPPWERASGGDLQVRGGAVSEPEPFANSIRQHLYRNALFRRLDLPQRFLALIQVEILDLKNLTSPGGSLSLSAYALVRLKRRGSSGILSNKTRTLDTAATAPMRLGKPTGVGPNAPASWGSVVRFRYPLPDDVAVDGTSFDADREALFKGPPSVLQITVYEKKLLVDHALGTADVDMDGLLAGGQVEEWVPLRSEKHGIHWFTRIRLTLRFELMCLASRDSKDLPTAAPSVGLQRIKALCQTGGAAAHEDQKRSISSPDLLQYLESMVY